jgi:hypothetical protein
MDDAFSSLPMEMKAEIFRQCDVGTFLRFTETSRASLRWLELENFWKDYLEEFGVKLKPKGKAEALPTWRDTFRQWYCLAVFL